MKKLKITVIILVVLTMYLIIDFYRSECVKTPVVAYLLGEADTWESLCAS